jgi:hypothetical protein
MRSRIKNMHLELSALILQTDLLTGTDKASKFSFILYVFLPINNISLNQKLKYPI